jgi:type IV fimbrial biogenesis protein FimT
MTSMTNFNLALLSLTKSREKGFTFSEVGVVMLLMTILMGIALPDILSYIKDAKVSTQATELVSDINLARTEAATRGRRAGVCVSTDKSTCASAGTSWTSGRIVFVDLDNSGTRENTEPLLRYGSPVSNDTSIAISGFTNTAYMGFTPYGGMIPVSPGTFKICIDAYSSGRIVTIPASGRPVISKTTCP